MPTGYTAKLADGEQSIQDFMKGLARGMGFCVTLRDEPWDAPLPTELQPSTWNAEKLAGARARMDELNSVSDQEAQELAHQAYIEEHDRWLADSQRQTAQADRYRAMIEVLEEWKPTHHAMKGMRDFGLQQIRESLQFDCGGYGLPEPVEKSGEDWLAEEIRKAQRDIDYYAAEHAKEVERTNGRNDALRALHAELAKFPTPEPQP